VKADYDEIIFSQNLHNAYALILFYSKYDPTKYLTNPHMLILKTPQNIWLELHMIDKYKISDVDNLTVTQQKRLIVVKPEELINYPQLNTIYYRNGLPALKIVSLSAHRT
jgi:hypothetical protein